MLNRQALAFLSVFGLTIGAGCPTKPAEPAKYDRNEDAPIRTDPNGQLQTLLDELEKSVASGDIGAIEAHWLLADDLAGCQHGSGPVAMEALSGFLEKQLQSFRDNAAIEMGEARRGSVLAVNKRSQTEPEIMNKPLTGESCRATSFGRINVIIKPEKAPPVVIEHRFNALYVGERWKLFRYLPGKPACTGPKAKQEWLGCAKLAEASTPPPP